MKTRPIPCSLAAAPLLLFLAPAAENLSFHPSDGSQASRDYSLEAEFELDEITFTVDGNDVSDFVPGDFAMTLELLTRTTDRFVKSVDGRPLELIRSFDERKGEAEAMGESEEVEGFDALEGKLVRFAWNEEDQEYDVAFHESEGEPKLIEDLVVDMDMRPLLPEREVAPGDTWTVDASALESVLTFGNSLFAMESPDEGEEEFKELLESELLPQFEQIAKDFETLCEFKGARDEDGRRVGAVKLDMHGEGKIDLSTLILKLLEMQTDGADIDLDAAELRFSFDSQGELLWDLEAGRLHGFLMEGDLEVEFELAGSGAEGGQSHEGSVEGALTGRLRWKVEPAQE